MKKKQDKNILQVQVRADKPVIAVGKKEERILEITLTAPPAPENRPHIPLIMSLVIDRSGSMHGEKLHYVKQAADHVIDLLTEHDRMAVILYDSVVTTLVHSQYLTRPVKSEIKRKIREVQSGASTFLYGGWLAGCRQVAEAIDTNKDTFNRTLLLSDGLANVGERDIGALSLHAQELFARRISTSCFGVGLDYDEYLLESMANHGGGSFHFLETLNAIPLVFEREFEEILSVTIRDLKIEFQIPESVDVSVPANWHMERKGDHLAIHLGSLMADQSQSVYLKLINLDGTSGEPINIPVTVTGLDMDQEKKKFKTSLTLKAVPAKEAASIKQDADLMARFAAVDLADKANEALKRERAGDRVGSSNLMQRTLFQHQPHILESDRAKYQHFSSEIQQGLDEASRKRRHYEEYQSKRGYRQIRHYPLRFENGTLMAEIDEYHVLVNTGAPNSIGMIPEWFFLHEVYRLRPEFEGITCQQLSMQLNTRVDVMLGMDILRDLFIHIEPDGGLITFSRTTLNTSGNVIDLHENNEMMSVRLLIAGRKQYLRLMTVSRVNLLPSEHLKAISTENEEQIEIPGIPPFTTSISPIPVEFFGISIPLLFGNLPIAVATKLGLAQHEGILGAALFQLVPATLAFPEKKLIMKI